MKRHNGSAGLLSLPIPKLHKEPRGPKSCALPLNEGLPWVKRINHLLQQLLEFTSMLGSTSITRVQQKPVASYKGCSSQAVVNVSASGPIIFLLINLGLIGFCPHNSVGCRRGQQQSYSTKSTCLHQSLHH